MDTVLTILRDYGTAFYVVLFAYCALKSGSLPLFAGYAAQTGALDPVLVGAATFAGGYLGDEARFAVSRRYGDAIADGRPKVAQMVERGRCLLDRYGVVYMFVYRYPKGMRTIGALPVGLTDMGRTQFTALNAASALVWTLLLVGVGYLFGESVEHAIASNWGLASVALLVVFVVGFVVAWRRLARDPKPGLP